MRTRARDARRGPRHVRARGELGSHGTPSGSADCALVLLHRAGDASPAGVAAYSTIEREGGGKLHALTM